MLYIVTYDIVDDRRRTRLAKMLRDFGDRVQYSVFECSMGTPELVRMHRRISKIIDLEADSVRIYSLCCGCERQVDIIGCGEQTQDPDVYIL